MSHATSFPASPSPQPRDVEVFTDLLGEGLTNGQISWRPYQHPGRAAVDVHWLYTAEETGTEGAEGYIAHQRPGSHTDLHRHLGFELVLVLQGELRDDTGERFPAGTLLVQHPDSIHRVSSPTGCKILVIREKQAVSLESVGPAAVSGGLPL